MDGFSLLVLNTSFSEVGVSLRFFIAGLFLLLARPLNTFGQDEKPALPSPVAAECALFDEAVKIQSSFGDSSGAFQTRLLQTYNAQARLVLSLKAVAVVRAIRGPKFGPRAGKSKEIAGLIDFEQPARIHITGVIPPFGARVFELASDDREIQMLAPDRNTMKFFVGSVDALPNGSDASDIARPREFIDALRWQVGALKKTVETPSSQATQDDTLDLDLPPRAGKSIEGKLHFDPQSGAVTSLQLYDEDGELVSELQYADWRTASDTSGGSSHGCFPRRVQLIQPMADLQLDIRFLELTLNPRIPTSSFHLSPSPGIPVVHLGSAGTNKEY